MKILYLCKSTTLIPHIIKEIISINKIDKAMIIDSYNLLTPEEIVGILSEIRPHGGDIMVYKPFKLMDLISLLLEIENSLYENYNVIVLNVPLVFDEFKKKLMYDQYIFISLINEICENKYIKNLFIVLSKLEWKEDRSVNSIIEFLSRIISFDKKYEIILTDSNLKFVEMSES